jgi:hypothetical protein
MNFIFFTLFLNWYNKHIDKDAGVNGLVEYFLVNSTEKLPHYDNSSINIADGYDVFAINYPHQGQVTVAKTLDFERVQRYYLTVVVSVRIECRLRLEIYFFKLIYILDRIEQETVTKDCQRQHRFW